MIIELDDSIAECADSLSEDERSAIREIASSRRKGINFIIGRKSTIASFTNVHWLDADTRSLFRKVYNDQTRWFNFLTQVNFRVRLTKTTTVISHLQEGETQVLVAPLASVLTYGLQNQPIIIAEDYTDIDFYEHMTRSYLKSKRVASVNCSYFPMPGGGKNTYRAVLRTVNKNLGISFCILDGDYEFPGDSMGDTAQNVVDIANQLPPFPYSKFKVLSVREAENIIPISTLNKILQSKANKITVTKLTSLRDCSVNGEQPIKYVDFKKGLKKHLANSNCDSTKKYWSKAIELSGLDKQCNSGESECNSVRKCGCQLVEGLGSDLLKSAVEHFSDHPLNYKELDSYIKTEWDDICEALVPYLFSPTAIAS
ncbi:hypothetical protein [Vibrio jasicida]|uniref:Wadjet protein JetD C-terminal domain-containing protein n=1 Tax=Vibrio jasicida TaxID=766224 RepID=A0ABW7J9Y4_9VIBR